jgi:hypothetical protein
MSARVASQPLLGLLNMPKLIRIALYVLAISVYVWLVSFLIEPRCLAGHTEQRPDTRVQPRLSWQRKMVPADPITVFVCDQYATK